MASSFICGWNRSTRRKPPGRSPHTLTNFITQCCIKYTSPRAGFELTTLVVVCTDCIGSCKSKYHTTTTGPLQYRNEKYLVHIYKKQHNQTEKQHYVIKCVSEFLQVGGFLWSPPPIKLTATI